jgi:hypothetical protein
VLDKDGNHDSELDEELNLIRKKLEAVSNLVIRNCLVNISAVNLRNSSVV